MRENLFVKILKKENNIKKLDIFPEQNMCKIIPEEYCIEVITTIPERKNIIEMIEL
ncbi:MULTISPECIES: hypothetical protein [Lacrimispora]|uniref:hypothetical protein n=1 Tax=Lacrimispora TaxID=2719231 RepID=UPI00140B9FD1|nr:hypothetical protein [Lacrimispora amygdalina]MDK2964842.1 hypothetical protein [Lacrimispora sp.]